MCHIFLLLLLVSSISTSLRSSYPSKKQTLCLCPLEICSLKPLFGVCLQLSLCCVPSAPVHQNLFSAHRGEGRASSQGCVVCLVDLSIKAFFQHMGAKDVLPAESVLCAFWTCSSKPFFSTW